MKEYLDLPANSPNRIRLPDPSPEQLTPMWTCRQCQEVLEDTFDSCWKCGTPSSLAPKPAPEPEPETPEHVAPQPIPRTPGELKDQALGNRMLSLGSTLLLGGIAIHRMAQSTDRFYDSLLEARSPSFQPLLAAIMIGAGAILAVAGLIRKLIRG